MDGTLRNEIRRARGKFAAMAGTYCLGVFNDSFYRNSAMLIAVYAGKDDMQGYVMSIFTLPYLLFAAPAGWLADRFPKRRVVIGAKLLELAAMLLGAVGIATGNWLFVMVMAFVMGAQSCLFSPALNGSIPELYPASHVMTANAILKVVVTASILTGIAASGQALGVKSPLLGGAPAGRWIVAGGVVLISALGVAVSFGVPSRPAAAPGTKFPWTGPLDTLAELWRIGTDRLLATIVAADAFAWFVGATITQVVNLMAKKQFSLGEQMAGYMNTAEVVGIAVGGMIASRVATGRRWHRVLPAAALAMGAGMLLIGAVPALPEGLHLPGIFVLLGAVGLAGGVFLIPCESFIQVRPDPARKGAVIAAANFAVFAGILASGPTANALNRLLPPTGCFIVLGGLALATAVALHLILPKEKET